MRQHTAFLLLAMVCAVATTAAATFPTIAGWTPTGELQSYDPSTLHEYINGAADVFLAYGFETLEVIELEAQGTIIAVSIYDMGSPLNAFGIYRTELPPGSPTVAIGAEAHLAPPYQFLMLKDRYYVKVDVYEGELDEAGATAVVKAIATSLPGSNTMPEAIRSFKVAGLEAGSERYTKRSYLGLRELDNCVWAKLAGDGDRQVFRILPDAGESVDARWQKLAAKWTSLDVAGLPALMTAVPYRGHVGVVRSGDSIVGVAGVADRAALLEILRRLGATG